MAAGGAERVVSIIIKELQHEFDIQLVLLSSTIEYELPSHQKIIFLNGANDGSGFLKLLKLPWLAYRYKQLCISNQIEVSFSFLKRANYINCLSKILGLKCKIIISERTFFSNYLKSVGRSEKILSKKLTRSLYPRADLIVPNSLLIKDDLLNNFKIRANYQVIYNPVSIDAIKHSSSVNVDPPLFQTFTFITVGRFSTEKNYELLISAFEKIKDLNCNLLFIGKGKEEHKLKSKVTQLKLESKIHFAGFDINPYKYLSKASCFVLSSDFEGFPNSIQEALACNLPVISTDCKSGPREILAPDTDPSAQNTDNIEVAEYGILVPVNNSDILANAMRLIYTDRELYDRLQQNAKVRAAAFSTENIINKFREILI